MQNYSFRCPHCGQDSVLVQIEEGLYSVCEVSRLDSNLDVEDYYDLYYEFMDDFAPQVYWLCSRCEHRFSHQQMQAFLQDGTLVLYDDEELEEDEDEDTDEEDGARECEAPEQAQPSNRWWYR